MAGMNPGFAAYLASRKTSNKTVAPMVTAPTVQAPMSSKNPLSGMVPIMAPQPKGVPRGKRHSKIKHVNLVHKKGK